MEFLLIQIRIFVLVSTTKKRACNLLTRLAPEQDGTHCQLLEVEKAVKIRISIKEPDETMSTASVALLDALCPCRLGRSIELRQADVPILVGITAPHVVVGPHLRFNGLTSSGVLPKHELFGVQLVITILIQGHEILLEVVFRFLLRRLRS